MPNLYRIKNRTYRNFLAVKDAFLPYYDADESWTITNCIFTAMETNGIPGDNAGRYVDGILNNRAVLDHSIALNPTLNREMVYYHFLLA